MSKPEWVKKCQTMLKSLTAHKHGWVFMEPVDPIKLQIPDYLDVIKRPMDLGTVKTNLSAGQIHTPEQFKDDVMLTFANAMRYNPAAHDVHVMAKTLSDQ
ncbi:Bromodomain-containing protein [Baffinella frigidus]|nr:Bromodomain-containing protein [Cryptophyta sp. CCMP2293]